MTLTEIFKTNCRATASLCKENPRLAFSELTSGMAGKNKNGTIARLSFNEFFIDLYFIENGPLAYAPNTIWLSVGFESCSFLPFAVYDILAVAEPENFKCYTYPYIYTEDVMVQAFGEINSLFDNLVPELVEISNTGTLKNNLIATQKETINKFVNDDIFKREIEMLDASLKIRNMLIRNFTESVLSHVILGGVSDFFNNEHEKAIKKLEKAKYLTAYENKLFAKLKSGELSGFDASPFRDAKFKDYVKLAKKHRYSLGKNGACKFLLVNLLFTPFTAAFLFSLYLLFTHTLFKDSLLFISCDVFSLFTIFLAGMLLAEIIALHFTQKIFNFFKRKKNKADEKPPIKTSSGFIKLSTILSETIIIILLFNAVNCSVAFYENKVTLADDSIISLKQASLRYEYIDTVYKVEGFYFNDEFFEAEHYIIASKNGDIIDMGLYLNNSHDDFESTVLPRILEGGCNYMEIKSEKDIK